MEAFADPELSRLVSRVGARVRLPQMRLVHRSGDAVTVADLRGSVREEVRRVLGHVANGTLGIAGTAGIGGMADTAGMADIAGMADTGGMAGTTAARFGPGTAAPPVAVAVGSRGIANLATIVATVVEELRLAGLAPFIVPAMGSHGGGTAEGQREVLAGYGITEERLGVPVRATMETTVIGETEGVPVHLDRLVAEAGRAFLVCRVKPHTDFQGTIESGAAKMAAIGLGKQAGAATVHGLGTDGLRRVMPAVGRYVADRHLLGALAVVENEFDETALVRGLTPGEVGRAAETALLEQARSWLPRLPADDIDLLLIDRMGKDVSGTGMDPNVIGRWLVPGLAEPARPRVRCVVVLDLTDASHGNAIGVGLADFAPARLLAKIDLPAFYLNTMTSGWAGLRRGRLPIGLPTDRDAVLAALAVAGPEAMRAARVVWISDTLRTRRCAVSEALWPEVAGDTAGDTAGNVAGEAAGAAGVGRPVLTGEPFALPFDAQGGLRPLDMFE